MKSTKFVKRITALIVIALPLCYFINIVFDYRIGMSTLLEDKSKQYNDFALYMRNAMEKYNNMAWLFKYWKEHYEEMDIQYDDKNFVLKKHEEFYKKFPVNDIHTISENVLLTLPDEAQKLYAEAEYMDWVEKFDDFKKFYHPTFLSCACLTDDGISRFYFLSGAEEGQKRGHGKTMFTFWVRFLKTHRHRVRCGTFLGKQEFRSQDLKTLEADTITFICRICMKKNRFA